MIREMRPATINDAIYVANTMRDEDRTEVWYSHGHTPHESVMHVMEISVDQTALVVDQIPVAITGLCQTSELGSEGSPWLLTTHMLRKHPKFLVQSTREKLDLWIKHRPYLVNYVWAEYKDSLRWASHCGFTVHPAERYGVWQQPFHKIDIRRDQWEQRQSQS